METHFARMARSHALTSRQREIVVGSVLGDGCLLTTTAGACFRVNHSFPQRELVDWKFAELEGLVRSGPRQCSTGGYYFRTVSHPEFAAMRGAFYSSGRKTIPIGLLDRYFSDLALTVLVMDDGSREGAQLRINTQAFSLHEVAVLRRCLFARFGLKTTVNSDKGMPRIRFRAASMDRLRMIVAPHMLRGLRYKLWK